MKNLRSQSLDNRGILKLNNSCYCLYCEQRFMYTHIEKWVDEGKTAICPHCDVDAVVPYLEVQGVSQKVLDEMKKEFLRKPNINTQD